MAHVSDILLPRTPTRDLKLSDWPASTYMSRNGRIEPGSLFATLQSAAMGGAGSIAVAKTAQTAAVLSSITLAYRTYLRGKR
jgi:hypothetical protein